MREPERVAEQFEDLEKQAHAARLGMWAFLASEVLLFAGIFALYAAYRAAHPAAFEAGVARNTRLLGSLNTLILLSSSYAIASAVTAMRGGMRGRTLVLVAITVLLGGAFVAIKLTEYAAHFREGIFPGYTPFWTLYFIATGLHAVHVTVGMTVLSVLGVGVARRRITAVKAHPLEIGALYWHLVDVIWIFLWPLFYLTPGGR